MLTIARHAFLESIRQPVFTVLILGCMLALVLNVNLAGFTFDDDNKILVDLGLSTLLLGGLLMATTTATTVLTREIENRTVLTVVSKPLPRPALVIGKYLGVVGALIVGFVSLASLFLLTVRHRVPYSDNGQAGLDGPVIVFGLLAVATAIGMAAARNYLFGRPFGSTFAVVQAVTATAAVSIVACIDREWQLQKNPFVDFDPQLLIAIALVFEATLVLAAVAITASTRLGSVMTLMACALVLLGGLVSEYFLGSIVAGTASASGWVRWLAWPFYAAIPNMQFFWTADALTQGHAISLSHMGSITLYGLSTITFLLSLAVALFQNRDVG
jgi:hypothetical protein